MYSLQGGWPEEQSIVTKHHFKSKCDPLIFLLFFIFCKRQYLSSPCLHEELQILEDYSPRQFFEALKSPTQILSIGCQRRGVLGVVWVWSPTRSQRGPQGPASPHAKLCLHCWWPSRRGHWEGFERALLEDTVTNRKNSESWEGIEKEISHERQFSHFFTFTHYF